MKALGMALALLLAEVVEVDEHGFVSAHVILTERGYLRGNLAYRVGNSEGEIGSPSVYAGVHQFGAAKGSFGKTKRDAPIPWGDIPARPFLGLSDEDEADIRDIVLRHLADSLG